MTPPIWILLGAAAASGALLVHAFRINGTPLLLRMIMAAWVLAPFAVLRLGFMVSRRWSPAARAGLRGGSVAAALATVGLYALDAVRPFSERAAAIYVMVPPASLLLVLAVVAGAVLTTHTRGN